MFWGLEMAPGGHVSRGISLCGWEAESGVTREKRRLGYWGKEDVQKHTFF
jgi:hypothetical protein